MSVEKAKKHLENCGIKKEIFEFDESSATVELAANALGCKMERIAKTLSFATTPCPILIVAAGDVKIDNSKFKQKFEQKAKMIPKEDVEALIGHGVGGVCPFGINDGVEVFLDESLKRFETVFIACGSYNSAVELSIAELEKSSFYKSWIDVCKSM